jgi:hypothetical protein
VSAVSAAVIRPVVPPVLSHSGGTAMGVGGAVSLSRNALPLPSLIAQRTSSAVYGMAALDDRGRIADRVVLRVLGWSAGLCLVIDEDGGLLVIYPEADGIAQVTGQGHLRVPAPLRHRCGLHSGDRVLLAADPERHRLVVYPPAALDALLSHPFDSMDVHPYDDPIR